MDTKEWEKDHMADAVTILQSHYMDAISAAANAATECVAHVFQPVCFLPQPASLMLGLAERSFQRWWAGVGAVAVLLGQRRGLLRRAPRRRGQSGARNGQDNALLGKMNHSGFVTQSLSRKHRRDLQQIAPSRLTLEQRSQLGRCRWNRQEHFLSQRRLLSPQLQCAAGVVV